MSRAQRQLESDLREWLRKPIADSELRDQFDVLAKQLSLFSGFIWLWGPELYRRNRVLFRPFILSRFGTAYIENPKASYWDPVEWKGEIGKRLDAWLRQVESDGDVSLFRKLFLWKMSAVGWRNRDTTLRSELLKRYRLATTADGRQAVLRRFDFPFPLDEAAALEIYTEDPGCGTYLLRHLDWGWVWAGETANPWWKVIELARSRGDESLAWSLYRAQIQLKEWHRDALEDCRAIRDPAVFARRAAAALGHVPAYAIRGYPILIRNNRLARLLFERTPASYLADPRSVADLVEGSEIHVMALAYRIPGLKDPRAVELARHHADLLVGTLLRRLHRITRRLAFDALTNAASTPELAARILARAREAFALPDDHYPKDALAALVAGILDRWPELRSPREQPVIFRKATRQQEAA